MSDNTVQDLNQETGETATSNEAEKTETTNASVEVTNITEKDDGKVTENAETNNTSSDEKEDKTNQEQPFVVDMDNIKLPEGITVTDENKKEFLQDVESLGINSQEGAQKFIDWIFKKARAGEEGLAKQQETEINGLEKKWVDEGKRDPVLGKEYDKNVSDAMDIASKVFSPRTLDFLKDTKFEKNPDFLKDMLRLSKERADAELISGKPINSKVSIRRDSQGNPMLTFNS